MSNPDSTASAAVPATTSPALPLYSEVRVERWNDGTIEATVDRVAEEEPVALTYQRTPHVVMLATPADLEDLGVGFTLSRRATFPIFMVIGGRSKYSPK